MKRRDFVKTVAMSRHGRRGQRHRRRPDRADATGQGPRVEVQGARRTSRSLEAKTQGCTYADVRFTRNTNSGVNANGGNREFDGFGGGFGGGGGAAAAAAAADAAAAAVGGFGGGGGGAGAERRRAASASA